MSETAENEALSQPLTIGVEAYISQEYARAERDRLWAKVWQQVGRVEELPDVGDYLTYEILDDSIIVVRTAPDTLRAYHNVCSHRGAASSTPAGQAGRPRPWQAVRVRVPRVAVQPGRPVHPCARTGGLAVRAVRREHRPDRGRGRHLGWLDLDQHGPGVRTPARLPGTRGHPARPLPAGEHALPVASLARLRLQLEDRPRGVHGDLPCAVHPPGVHEVRQFPRLVQGPGQAQQHRLRRAQGPGREPGEAAARRRHRPRESTAELQNFTWANANTNTTQTLVDAANRLVEEVPEDATAADVLRHWLDTARRTDAERGVSWPTVEPAHVAKSGTAWQIFPNFQIGHALNNMLCYSARPHGHDPDKCVFEVAVYELYPPGEEPETEWVYTPEDDPDWRTVLPQDFTNMAAVQKGMKARGFGPEAQPVPRTQHREPAPQPGDLHGYRRTPRPRLNPALPVRPEDERPE